jgi:hypothetical protein
LISSLQCGPPGQAKTHASPSQVPPSVVHAELWQRPGAPASPLLLDDEPPLLLDPDEEDDDEEADDEEEAEAAPSAPPSGAAASARSKVGSSTQPSSERTTAMDRPNRRPIFGLSHAGRRSC